MDICAKLIEEQIDTLIAEADRGATWGCDGPDGLDAKEAAEIYRRCWQAERLLKRALYIDMVGPDWANDNNDPNELRIEALDIIKDEK